MTAHFAPNIAFAGLTAAGKTTHAKRLASQLGYEYVSATDILLEMLGIDDPSDQIWFTRLEEIDSARSDDDAIDNELEVRLLTMNRNRQRTVFDTWSLGWIGDDPLVRIWIESDLESRTRKCFVSQRSRRLSLEECGRLVRSKDDFNRESFRQRHGFDLFTDRHRYDAVLCNSHLIPTATEAAARVGIATFAPVVHAATTSVIDLDSSRARDLRTTRPREALRIKVPGDPARTTGAS